MDKAWATENEAWALVDETGDALDALRANELFDITRDIVAQIEDEAALTLAGLLVKMRAIACCRGGHPMVVGDLAHGQAPSTDVRLAAGILGDLRGMTAPEYPSA